MVPFLTVTIHDYRSQPMNLVQDAVTPAHSVESIDSVKSSSILANRKSSLSSVPSAESIDGSKISSSAASGHRKNSAPLHGENVKSANPGSGV